MGAPYLFITLFNLDKYYFSLSRIRIPQIPIIKNRPDKQKNNIESGLKRSVFKYTIEPLSNKKHEIIIKEIKIKLRFVIQQDSSLNLKTLSSSSSENHETPTTNPYIEHWTYLN